MSRNLTRVYELELDESGDDVVECGLSTHDWLTIKLCLISVIGSSIALFGVFGNISTVLIFSRPGWFTDSF